MKLNLTGKKILVLAVTLFLYCSGFSQKVQIYHIGIGQGDATLILLQSKAGQQASILIDAGNSKSKGDVVFDVVNHYLGSTKKLDMIIVSHLHSDHMGGMPEVLLRLKSAGYAISYIFDRAARGQNNGDEELCYDNGPDADNDPVPAIPSNQLVKNYQNAVTQFQLQGWYNILPGLDLLQSFLPTYDFKSSNMSFTSLASNGDVCKTAADYSQRIHVTSSKNENDNSYAFLLQMDQFKYFTGGDIGGEKPYADLETPLVNYFNTRPDVATFHFCAYKASHHGSAHSTNAVFIKSTNPTVTVVPSALRSFSGTQLPGRATIERITDASKNVYLYFTYTFNHYPWAGRVENYNDVVINVDGTTYNANHTMSITQQLRDKATLSLQGTSTTTNATCYKLH